MGTFKNYLKTQLSVTDEQFSLFENDLKIKRVQKGKILLMAHNKTNSLYFVCSGLLRLYTIDKQGKEHIIQFTAENSCIGDRNSVCFDEPAQFFIDAVEDSEVVVINKRFLEIASFVIEDFSTFTILNLQDMVRDIQMRVSMLLTATAEERYLNFIELYPDLSLRLSQAMIASYLGLTPESLSRVRRKLAKRLDNCEISLP